jgi:hypothetical protein
MTTRPAHAVQAAESGRHLRSAVPTRVDGEEIRMIDTSRVDQDRKTTRRGWLVGSAAAAAIVGIVGIVAIRAADDDAADVGIDDNLAASPLTSPPADVSTSPPAEVSTTTPADAAIERSAIVPEDALREPTDEVVAPTGETQLPDFENAILTDDGGPRLPLGSVGELPGGDWLDFLAELCQGPSCFRDAVMKDDRGVEIETRGGSPFHVRQGFVTDGGEPLGDGFDLVLYVFPMEMSGGNRAATGPTQRFTTDYVVRGETDACGPDYQSQTGTVSCEWFVHDFPNGLPEGRWALWAVWEAPCSAWIELGRTASCADPDEVMSFFSSGVDSPFGARSTDNDGDPVVTEVGDWTRIDGLDIFGLVSDGTAFFSSDGWSVQRSYDGITWEEYAELGEPIVQFEAHFEQYGSQFEEGPTAAVRDGRLVAVEDLRGSSVVVHVVESDGTRSTQVVPVEIPAAYDPFHRELKPGVHLLDDGRVVVTASYSADAGLVEATGRTRAELGLDLFYPMPRPIVISSADGVTWNQLETPPDRVVYATTATGGLVAHTGPFPAGHADRVVSFSTDGATWEPVLDPDTGAPMQGDGGLVSVNNRAFLLRGEGQPSIWEIANGDARLIAGPGAAQEPLELFERFHFGQLSAGDAGLAYVVAVDEEMRDPAPDGRGIRYSVDDGETWEFDPFPEELATGYAGALSVGASQIVLLQHGADGDPSLWVREFPG